jgi:outer membrane PBP1 activator LpoA protein
MGRAPEKLNAGSVIGGEMSFRKMKTGPGSCTALVPRRLVAAAMLAGLCALAQANTTAYPAGLLLAQNDISLMPGAPVETESVPAYDIVTQPQGQAPGLQGSDPVRVGILLPLRSESLRTAAAMVRDGFIAAYEKSRDTGLSLTVIETGDAAQDVLDAYASMLPDVDIMVGPLSRSGTAAIATRGTIDKPTIALTPADAAGPGTGTVPQLLSMGLSLEDDARQAAEWAVTEQPGEMALVVSTSTAWQRRAARAFQAAWQRRGLAAELFELSAAGGNLSASALAQLQERLRSSRPGLVFAALDAAQARQLRESIGADLPMYGTSQLNPYTPQGWAGVDARADMNGVRFIDLPWLLRPDSAASAGYARPAAAPEQARSADMERLYALGVDAYQVARGVAAQRGVFDVNGATGRLKVSIGAGPARFERTASPAVYRDGIAAPMSGAP